MQAECSDWDHWKKAYDAHAPARVGFQEDIFVGHEAADPNKVILIVEIPSMEAMQALQEPTSHGLRGVRGEWQRWWQRLAKSCQAVAITATATAATATATRAAATTATATTGANP